VLDCSRQKLQRCERAADHYFEIVTTWQGVYSDFKCGQRVPVPLKELLTASLIKVSNYRYFETIQLTQPLGGNIQVRRIQIPPWREDIFQRIEVITAYEGLSVRYCLHRVLSV